jgi:hypothetical protein
LMADYTEGAILRGGRLFCGWIGVWEYYTDST